MFIISSTENQDTEDTKHSVNLVSASPSWEAVD